MQSKAPTELQLAARCVSTDGNSVLHLRLGLVWCTVCLIFASVMSMVISYVGPKASNQGCENTQKNVSGSCVVVGALLMRVKLVLDSV